MMRSMAVLALAAFAGCLGGNDGPTGPNGKSGGTDTGHVTVPPPAQKVPISIVLGTPVAGDNLVGMQVRFSWGTDSVTTTSVAYGVSGDAIAKDSVPVSTSTITVKVIGDVVHYPMYREAMKPEWSDSSMRAVIIPRQWTVNAGTYKGQTFAVSLDDLLAPSGPKDSLSFLALATKQTPYGATQYLLGGWDNLPRPLALDPSGSDMSITTQDSALIWKGINFFQDQIGIQFYRPGTVGEAKADGKAASVTSGTVAVFQSTMAIGTARAGVSTDLSGSITSGKIYMYATPSLIRQDLQSFYVSQLFIHELIHTLWTGHTCDWTTLMTSSAEFPSGTCAGKTSGGVTTVEDIAMLQLKQAVYTKIRSSGSMYHFVEAWNGRRVLEQNLATAVPPTASLASSVAP